MKEQFKLTFSIIIPTYNRPLQLNACLRSLARLDYPRDRFEVIVVDDGSPVSLEPEVSTFCNRLNVKLITQSNAGPAAARNAGAAHAKGKFLAFIDDDCMPASDWLQVLTSRFKKTPDCIIGGRTINFLTDNAYSITSQLITDVVYRHYNAEPNQSRFFATNNMALSASRFFMLGGFNPNFTTSEDREFCDRSLYYGFQMIYAPEAVVYHAHSLQFGTFCKQHFSYGRGAFQFHLNRVCRSSGSPFREFKFHLNLRNWLLYPFSQAQGSQKIPLAALLIVWQVMNTSGFFWEVFSRIFKGSIQRFYYTQADISRE